MSQPYIDAPLVTVITEIRFPSLPTGTLAAAEIRLRKALKPWLPLTDSIADTQVELVAGQTTPTIKRQEFPRFKNRNSSTALVVKDSLMVLETTEYDGYEGYRLLVEGVVRAISSELAPDGVARVGLRYIDEIRVPHIDSSPGDWNEFIHGALLSAVDPSFLLDGVTAQAWQGAVNYKTGTDQTLLLRYGPAEGYATDPNSDGARRINPLPPGSFFLLDADSSWTGNSTVPEFNADEIVATLDRLHAPVKAVFESACTDELRRVFNREVGSK